MIIQTLVTIVFICGVFFLSGANAKQVIDLPSVLALLLISVPVFLASGHGRNLLVALKILRDREKRHTMEELKNSGDAIKTLMIVLVVAGFCITIVGLTGIAAGAFRPEALFANLLVAMLPLFYSAFLLLLILPAHSRIVILQNKAYGEEY